MVQAMVKVPQELPGTSSLAPLGNENRSGASGLSVKAGRHADRETDSERGVTAPPSE